MKKCSRCKEIKPETPQYFHRNLSKLTATCKVCRCSKQKEWREQNPKYMIKWWQEKKQNSPHIIKEYRKRGLRNFRTKFPDRVSCYNKVQYALRTGKLRRLSYCETCGKKSFTEADHSDYTKPLDVRWLCKSCHVSITMERKYAL